MTAFSPAVIPLVDGVKKFKGVAVHRASARALERLSKDPHNCCIMHQHGILKVSGCNDDDDNNSKYNQRGGGDNDVCYKSNP